jgi:hypothetical protein
MLHQIIKKKSSYLYSHLAPDEVKKYNHEINIVGQHACLVQLVSRKLVNPFGRLSS